jgi:hypothetical protein
MRVPSFRLFVLLGIGALVLAIDVRSAAAQEPQEPAPPSDPQLNLPEPKPIPEFRLPDLKTIPVPRGLPVPSPRGVPVKNWTMVDTAALPKDPEGIWILEFAFKPVRVVEVELPGGRRRKVHYLYWRVVNRTGAPRQFVPQFTLVTDDGKRYEDTVLPLAVKVIQAKEHPDITPLLGAVESTGTIPPSEKPDIDDAVYGVAIWDDVDFAADAFSVFVRGLTDASQVVEPPGGGEPITRYKAVRIDFARPGDELSPHSREIQLKDPAYEWVYYP